MVKPVVKRVSLWLKMRTARYQRKKLKQHERLRKELVDLGLISTNDIKKQGDLPAYKKYYMHGTSHHLGLDVHDVSNPKKALCEGMVLTCEPGIYIPQEGLGIRLENDILITREGPKDLMDSILIEAEEIEGVMNR